MHIKKKAKMFFLILVSLSIIVTAIPVKAQTFLTKEEQDYINKENIINAISLHGAAPIQYEDENGEIKGISIDLLEEISNMTGLIFEYDLYDTIDEVFASDADIIFGIPYNYATDTMIMSQPYLESETILYINSSIDLNKLDDKIYAAVTGSDLPEGIKEENSIYFDTREESLEAVEAGQADYGYGNAYSVAYYRLKNNYKNIIEIPMEKESRAYCVGFLKDNEMLLSIINKSINSISTSHMQALILNATTQIERKITLSVVIDAYGIQIFGTILLLMVILLVSIILNVKSKRQLKIQNERYQILSQISNEYMYEYNIRSRHLDLSQNFKNLLDKSDNYIDLVASLKRVLDSKDYDSVPVIESPIADDKMGVFKSVNSAIYDDKGRVYSVIGKLIDISEEEIEKQQLIKQSEIDGLTGLYNATTSRRLITESIVKDDFKGISALIIIDCDDFKEINDTYGHLQGNSVLEKLGHYLRKAFRNTDIIGRIGGDEFCVYMQDIQSIEFALSRCREFITLTQELDPDSHTTVSIGISLLIDFMSYEDLFRKADKALYEAKKKGGNQIQLL